MRIAQVSPVYPPYRGGMGTVCQENARMAAEAGHDVVVYTPRYPGKLTQQASEAVRLMIRRLIPWLSYGNAAVVPQLAWQLRSADVIHFHYPFIGGFLPVLIAKLTSRAKLIVTYHMDLVGRDSWKYPVFKLYNKITLPLMVRYADRIVLSSYDYGENSFIAPWIQKLPEKFVELHHSVDTLRFHEGARPESLLGRHGIGKDTPVILFVGGLDDAHYFKGVHYLLEAFSLMNHVFEENGQDCQARLVIVGEGNLRPRYAELAVKLGLESKVVFAGSVSDDDLPLYYHLADLIVLPSVDSSESFGVVLIDGMASGKAVLASHIPGVRSVVRDGINGWTVESRSVEELAAKMATVVTDRPLLGDMGTRGLEIVKKEYSHDAVSKVFEQILTAVVVRTAQAPQSVVKDVKV